MIAIVGGSIAAYTAYNTIKAYSKNTDVKVLSKENTQPYGKMLLPYMLTSNVEGNMFYKIPEEDLIINTEITGLDIEQKIVTDSNGNRYRYEKLIIATGADAYKETFQGDANDRIFTVRYLRDIQKIRAYIKTAQLRHVVIYGGGLVSLEMANALYLAGFKITMVISSNRILSQILNKRASELFEKYLNDNYKLKIIKGERIETVEKSGNGTVIRLSGGKSIECDFVVVGKGVQPNIDFVKNKLNTKNGIIVNDRLEASDCIYAIGDVAEVEDVVLNEKSLHAIWPCAIEQAEIAAKNSLGMDIKVKPEFTRNVLPVFGMNIFTGGVSKLDEYDVIIEDYTDGYSRIMTKDGYLDGFVFFGLVKNYGAYTFLARNRIKVKGAEKKLLHGCIDTRRLL